MTEKRVATCIGLLRSVTGTAVVLTALLLSGCGNIDAGPAAPKLRVYAADVAGGAKVCNVQVVNPAAGTDAKTPMKVANDGGWCGIRLHQNGLKPFEAGLLTARPDHGTVLIHEVGDETRIDYTPDHGFIGGDAFAVKLLPGDATIRVGVTVTAPEKVTGSL